MRADIATLILVLTLSGCDGEPILGKLPATDEVLSQYQTIHIGSVKLTLPTIALLSSTADSNLTVSDGTRVAIEKVLSQNTNNTTIVRIDLNVDAYRMLQDHQLDTYVFVSRDFCERLLARWEKNQCAIGLYDEENTFYPRYFQLLDRAYLTDSNDQLFAISGAGPMAGEAARTLLANNSEHILCTQGQQPLCTAIMPISGGLVAVWATRREEFEADKKRIAWLTKQYINKAL